MKGSSENVFIFMLEETIPLIGLQVLGLTIFSGKGRGRVTMTSYQFISSLGRKSRDTRRKTQHGWK